MIIKLTFVIHIRIKNITFILMVNVNRKQDTIRKHNLRITVDLYKDVRYYRYNIKIKQKRGY